MTKIITYIKDNKVLLSILVVLLGIVLILGKCLQNSKDEQARYRSNFEAVSEELKTEQLKCGDYLYSMQAYELTVQELQDIVDMSKKELKDLQNKVGKLQTYVTMLETIQVDSIVTVRDSIVYVNDAPSKYLFNYSDDWISLEGTSDILKQQTKLSNISIRTPLEVGLSADNTVFVKTPNPYVNISEVVGANIVSSKKSSKWAITLSIGLYSGYNVLGNSQLYFGPGAGIGGSYIIRL